MWLTVPMSAGSWAIGILRKTFKKQFLTVFPMPAKNFQKTLNKPSAALEHFEKTSKNILAPTKNPQKSLPGNIFMSFGFQMPPKGARAPPLVTFSEAKTFKNVSREDLLRVLESRGTVFSRFFKISVGGGEFFTVFGWFLGGIGKSSKNCFLKVF